MKQALLLILCLALSRSALCQWTLPTPIDPTLFVLAGANPRTGIGPQGEIAVALYERTFTGKVSSYTSVDSGRTYARATVAEGVFSPTVGTKVRSVDDVGFTANGDLAVLVRTSVFAYDISMDISTWASVQRSPDRGAMFGPFWNSAMLGYGGVSPPFGLDRCRLYVGQGNIVNVLRDTSSQSLPDGYGHALTTLEIGNPLYRQDIVLAHLAGNPAASADLLFQDDTMYYAAELSSTLSSDHGLFFARAVNGQVTVPIAVDTATAADPQWVGLSSGEKILIYASGGEGPYADTTMVGRILVDTTFSLPFRLGTRPKVPGKSPSVQTHGTAQYLVYEIQNGVAWYEFHDPRGGPTDSAFFIDHAAPSLAIDSLGGQYLVTVYQNRLCLMTKDVVLSVGPTPQVPLLLTLEPNYPNPFNLSTSIGFSLSSGGTISLTVYDVLGRRIATVVDGPMLAGHHSVPFDATDLASGMYMCRLLAGGMQLTMKMVLMK